MSKKIKNVMPEMSADMPKAKRTKITTLAKQIRDLENIHPNFRTKEQKKEIKKLQSEIQDYFDRRNSQIKTLVKEKAFVKKRGRPRKDMPEEVQFTDSDLRAQKARANVVKHLIEPKHAFIPVDAFNPLDPDYDELYQDNMPKKKMGRPRKNNEPTPKPLFEKKCQNCGAEFKSKLNRNKFCSVKCRNKDFYTKNYKRKTTLTNQDLDTKITATEKPLESFTKRTVIVGESNQKETLALEFSNQRVDSLMKENGKLLAINNEKIIEVAKLKSELNKIKELSEPILSANFLKESIRAEYRAEYDMAKAQFDADKRALEYEIEKLKELANQEEEANKKPLFRTYMRELSLNKSSLSRVIQLKIGKYDKLENDKITPSVLRSMDNDIARDILNLVRKRLNRIDVEDREEGGIESENYYKEEIEHLKNKVNKLEFNLMEANTEAFNAKNQLASLEAFLHKEQNKNNKFSLKRFFATLFVFLLGWVIGIAIMFAMANF